MKKSVKKPKSYGYIWVEVLIGVIGLIMSVVLHELFHVLMHLDQVPHIGLFPQHSGAIAEVLVWLPQGYDLEGEEIIAYLITLTVWIVTLLIIIKVHDGTDTRSASQILFPNDKEMQKLSPAELLELAERADPGQVMVVPTPVNKPQPKIVTPKPAKAKKRRTKTKKS